MRFPIEGGALAFVVAGVEEAVDFRTKQPRTTEDGRPVFRVTVLAMDGVDSAPIRVRVDGDPGLTQGQPVRVVGLAMNQIARDGGMTWWSADGVQAAGPPIVPGQRSGSGSSPKAAE